MRLVDDAVERLLARARREIDSGLLPSCQIALALDGEVMFAETLGDATADNRYIIYSSTKPVVASAAWLLIQSGDLDVERPVTDFVPTFMEQGEPDRRNDVTVEQVMLHTSGFPHAPLGPPTWSSREGRLEKMATWRFNWEPGSRYEYHATSAHWVLAEVVEVVAGRDFRDVVREGVLGPHGLDRLRVGVEAPDQVDIVDVVPVGEEATPDELEAALGVRELPVTEVTPANLQKYNWPDVRETGVPGGGGVSNASDLALFYQALLHNPHGVWDADLLADVTGEVRNDFPEPLGRHPVLRTLGLCTAGDDGKSSFRGFGKTVSGAAFGHNGAGGQIAWADPATGLSFAYLTNGLDAHPIRLGRRGVALSSIAATCAA